MNYDKMLEIFDKHEAIEIPQKGKIDLAAFQLLAEIFPKKSYVICHADIDQIWFHGDYEKLTEKNILDLTKCGVFFDTNYNSLSMFV